VQYKVYQRKFQESRSGQFRLGQEGNVWCYFREKFGSKGLHQPVHLAEQYTQAKFDWEYPVKVARQTTFFDQENTPMWCQ
jgi:hypothetical protein